jgi:hypothetical protein
MADIDDDELLDALGIEVAPLKVLRTSFASIRPMAGLRYMERTATSLNVFMPCASINYANYRRHTRC